MLFVVTYKNKMLFYIILSAFFVCVAAACIYLIYLLKTRFVRDQYELCTPQQTQHAQVSNNHKIKLLYLIAKTEEILSRFDRKYWACSGTLLAAVRQGHLTPWDDDADYCVVERPNSDDPIGANIKAALAKENLYLDTWLASTCGVYQLNFAKNHPMLAKYPSETKPFVDWCIVRKFGTKYKFSTFLSRLLFAREYFTDKETQNLQKYNLNLSCHDNSPFIRITSLPKPIDYLNRAYGTSNDPSYWRKNALASSHRDTIMFCKPCKMSSL